MGFFFPNTFLFVEERFIAIKAKQLNLNNYVLLEGTYVRAHSKNINTAYNQVEKYGFAYLENIYKTLKETDKLGFYD